MTDPVTGVACFSPLLPDLTHNRRTQWQNKESEAAASASHFCGGSVELAEKSRVGSFLFVSKFCVQRGIRAG